MESAAEYTARLRGYVADGDPVQILANTAKTIRTLIRGKSEAALRTKPGEGRWSVGEIIAHLGDAEYVVGYRIRSVLGQNGAPLAGYDQSQWAKAMRYETLAPSYSLQRFEATRNINIALLASLAPSDWDNYGIHSERGRESVRDIVVLDAGHDVNHLTQIRVILSREAGEGS